MPIRDEKLKSEMRRFYLRSHGWLPHLLGNGCWMPPKGLLAVGAQGQLEPVTEAEALNRTTKLEAAQLIYLLGDADSETRTVLGVALLLAVSEAVKKMFADPESIAGLHKVITELLSSPSYRTELRVARAAWAKAWADLDAADASDAAPKGAQ